MNVSGWNKISTLESYIRQEQRTHPHSRGIFSGILRRIGLASKIIGAKVQKAGLLAGGIIESRDTPDGIAPREFHAVANDIMKSVFQWIPSVAGIVSHAETELISLPRHPDAPEDRYIVLFDPLDGAGNIDANVSAGTIFSIHRIPTGRDDITDEDFLMPGYKQVGAGYVIYGSSTMLVFTTGQGVHGFTLDPEVGEYILSHENILLPDEVRCLSVNSAYREHWDAPTRRFVDLVSGGEDPRYERMSSRYIGSFVADLHRNLLYGGVFLYPIDPATGEPKLHLTYECAPMAMIYEQAGGTASTGRERILDIKPAGLHQRVPLVIGNRREVEIYEALVREEGSPATGRG